MISRLEFLEMDVRRAGQRLAEEIAREFPVDSLVHVRYGTMVYRAVVVRPPEAMCPTLLLVCSVDDESHVALADWKDCARVPS